MSFPRVNKIIFATVFVLLLLLAGSLNAQAEEMDPLEIRGPVYSGMNLEFILASEGGQLEMDALNFPVFYYDVDNDISTESLIISGNDAETGSRRIGEEDLVYSTCVNFVDFACQDAAWTDEDGNPISNYPLLALFGEPYVPLDSNSPDKLAPLLLDDDEKYALKANETLDLGEGYALTAREVDVNGGKVLLEFSKDGENVTDEFIYVNDPSQAVWQVDIDDVEGEDDVIVLRVHVDQVFQGAVDSIARIDGLWLIDYEDVEIFTNDMEYGKFEVNILESSLEFTNPDSIYLEMDSEQEITEELSFVVADANELRFYVMEEYAEPGIYEIRGEVVEYVEEFKWDCSNFPAFFYDIDDNICLETLSVEELEGRTIPEASLIYRSYVEQLDYEYGGWNNYDGLGGTNYSIVTLFGELFVPLGSHNTDKLAPLLLDSDEEYVIHVGKTLDLGSGYGLKLKQIDSEGSKAFLEFTMEGEVVANEVVTVNEYAYDSFWNLELDGIEGEDDILVMRVHLKNLFKDGDNSFTTVDGLWLIDYGEAISIDTGKEFGVFETDSITSTVLEFRNYCDLTLDADSIQELSKNMYFRVADNNTLRFYPFMELTFAGSGSSSGGGSSGENWTSWDDPES
ncbi:MAG: S-layer protein domain-containing protein, partial [Methanosarcinaceae archaeon]|nr:S-layer protein domain-containing protein [Methanosarcinaceae archaeon]